MKRIYQEPIVTKWQSDEEDVLTASLGGTIDDQDIWGGIFE